MNKALIVLLALVALGAGCSQNKTSSTTATINEKFDPNGVAVNRTKKVTSSADVDRLLAYFSEAGKGLRGPQGGSFQSAVDIVFKRKNHPSIHVWTDYNVWTEGQGNWPLGGTFTSTFNEIMSK